MSRRLLAIAIAMLVASAGAAGARTTDVPRWKAWLCRPGQKIDYCNVDYAVTLIAADGSRRVVAGSAPRRPIDCFYLYPTISDASTGGADLKIDQAEKQVAIIEAAPFGQVCGMLAPLYRQADEKLSYPDAAAAWHDYLAHYNHGRGVVLIGHSHGAFMLTDLIRNEIEGSPAVRKLLVSALLLGGNITVAKGSDTGGSFERLPACRAAKQVGCVVAYSSWGRTPPQDAAFERVDGPSQQVLCVNPAAPGGGSAPITPVFPWFAPEGIIPGQLEPAVQTLWVGLPGLYRARCVTQGSRAWLLVESVAKKGDRRPLVQEVLSPNWGLHAADVNIALADLVDRVRVQGRAWTAAH